MQIINIKDWGLGIHTDGSPLVISGPCSAETEQQVHQTYSALAKYPVHILRAGIWKPRTRPNSFEGVGSTGLQWIKQAGKMAGLPVCVEVANAQHVEEALQAGIDILWIGARTTVNPFAVQEIANALVGIDIPVMIKNPINPDLELWIGAIERLYQAGIRKLAAIHRGFSIFPKDEYRNSPQWNIPIELRRRIRGLEIIADPSHICGNRHMLKNVAQTALDLNFDGIMLESHCNPDEAWSDAKQQVTPAQLGNILAQLIKRQKTTNDPIFKRDLKRLREEIDAVDYQFLDLLRKRMEFVREIGDYKKENNVAILQIERWEEIYRTRMVKAPKMRVDIEFVEGLLQAIHKESIRQQTEILNKKIPIHQK
ncbi:MAG: bifunctional 3-deoxy-7-phosphoheptulonate synthase/chorismate mutase type II [Saprospiraceae bacterium]|nr:bifunctional 3-deoxy-7-phosphoheptulonate synthase/chorismate mutase type II [Saprospiraceae bacterium]